MGNILKNNKAIFDDSYLFLFSNPEILIYKAASGANTQPSTKYFSVCKLFSRRGLVCNVSGY